MRQDLSIIIICKNEADNIDRTLTSVQGAFSDIVVYDSGSTDATVAIVEGMGLQVHHGPWLGYGATRRAAIELAKNDWVLCLDADEYIGESLFTELLQLELQPGTAWEIQLRNHLGRRYIRYGAWGNDFRLRLFHRKECNWNDAPIHEKVVPLQPMRIRRLNGSIVHRTAKNLKDYRRKLASYAELTAKMYHQQGRQATLPKRLFGPLLTFLKNYVGKLGFLEGKLGWKMSWATAGYTWKKYAALNALWRRGGSSAPVSRAI